MKKHLILSILSGCLLLMSCKQSTEKPEETGETTEIKTSDAPAMTTRYSIKSAKVTTTMQMPGGMGTSNTILYFDDYGDKEMRESISVLNFGGKNMNKTTRTIIKDDYIYMWEIG